MKRSCCEQTHGFRELLKEFIRGLGEILLLRGVQGGQDLSPLALVDLKPYVILAQMLRWKVHTLGVSVSESSASSSPSSPESSLASPGATCVFSKGVLSLD